MGVGGYSSPLRGVGVLAMPDAGLDTMLRVECFFMVPLAARVLGMLVPSVAVGVIIHRRCIADGVEVTRCVLSAMRELFSEDEGGGHLTLDIIAYGIPSLRGILLAIVYGNASQRRRKL
jgi:hypothetical protein